jgi:hypothetical protein
VFWRKWLVRLLVFSLLSGFGAVGYLYQRWTNPAAVRRQVLAKLRELFPGAEVSLESARMRLFGGIALNELRLTRRNDADQTDFAYIPSAILYHDKERLLSGALALRKVEIHRPRLRIVRDRKGAWNVMGITGPSGPEAALPTIVVHQGTLLIEDQLACPGSSPVELRDINISLINDPLTTVTIEGSGQSDLAGRVQIRATWQRPTNELALTLQADQVPVGPPLVHWLGSYCAEVAAHGRYLEGMAALRAELCYRPQSSRPWTNDIRWHLGQGKLRHPQLPLPLDQLEADLRYRDGKLLVEKMTAQAGVAGLKLTQATLEPARDGFSFEAKGSVEHLSINKDLAGHCPLGLKNVYTLFRPVGPASLTFNLRYRDGKWSRQHVVLRPEGMQGTFTKFPYTLERIQGSLDIDWMKQRVVTELRGFTGTRPVEIKGEWQGPVADPRVEIDVAGQEVPLDQKLLQALPPAYQKLAHSFHLTGRGDFVIHIRHARGSSAFANHYQVRLNHGTMRWDEFPYPLEEVSGILDIRPDHWELSQFQGNRGGGVFRAEGRSYPAGPGRPEADSRVAIQISGANVGLNKDMKTALDERYPCLAKAWSCFDPAGRMNFKAQIDRLPRQPQDLDITVDVHGCGINPQFFRYRLENLSGSIHYCKNRVEVSNVHARHGPCQVQLPRADVELFSEGGMYVLLRDLQAAHLHPDAAFRQALPVALRKLCETLELQDPVDLKARKLVVSLASEPGSRPDVYWDGLMNLREARLRVGVPVEGVTGTVGCVGRHNGSDLVGVDANALFDRATVFGLPFQTVHAKIDILEDAPDVVVVGLKAPLFGGQISGPGRVELSSTLRYELDLTASEIKLDALGRHTIGADAQLSGLVGGRLHVMGKGTGIASLEGNGSLDMPKGRLYNLPLLLDLLKFLGLRWPDRTAFEQAHAAFTLHGERLRFNHLELYGNAVSLHGQGDMKLDGTDVRLDFIPVWGRIEQLLPPVWQPIPSAIGKNLLKIEMRGQIDKLKDLHFHKKPVPGLIGPLLDMRDRLAGGAGFAKPSDRGNKQPSGP